MSNKLNFHREFTLQKKLNLPIPYFYVFLVCSMFLSLFSTIAIIFDLQPSSINEQVTQLELTLNPVQSSELYSNIREKQIIKFVTFIICVLSFCLMCWLGIRKLFYGYAFTIIWLVVFSLLLGYVFILELKANWYDTLQTVVSSFLIIGLLFWGFRQKYYRITLQQKLRNQRT